MNYERLENGSNGLVLTASLDDLVFEGKNRSYGGYQMRESDNRRLMMSFYITGIFVLLITLIFYMRLGGPELPKTDVASTLVEDPFEDVIEVEIEDPVTEDKPEVKNTEPAPPQPPVQEPVATQEFKTPNPTVNAVDTATVISQSEIKKDPGLTNSEGGGTVPMGQEVKTPSGTTGGNGNGGVTEIDINDPKYWETEQPVALNLDAIKGKIRYPEQLKDIGYEGDVVLKLLVDEKGNYLRHEVKKTSHDLFSKEVSSHLKDLKFKPGKQAGKEVRVWVIVPFKFRLHR